MFTLQLEGCRKVRKAAGRGQQSEQRPQGRKRTVQLKNSKLGKEWVQQEPGGCQVVRDCSSS